jgi:hypothetical protein
MLTVMFNDIPIVRAINSYELGMSIFNCGGTTKKPYKCIVECE